MELNDLTVLWKDGVLRPEQPLNLPDRTSLVISIRRIGTTPEAEEEGRQRWHEIRRKGLVRSGGWRPTRDEMHERD